MLLIYISLKRLHQSKANPKSLVGLGWKRSIQCYPKYYAEKDSKDSILLLITTFPYTPNPSPRAQPARVSLPLTKKRD